MKVYSGKNFQKNWTYWKKNIKIGKITIYDGNFCK